MNDNGVITIRPRKPRWWRDQPDMTLDVRAAESDAYVQEIIKAADQLPPRQTLSIRLDYEPELLYRMMGKKGFDHRSQSQANGAWRIDFYRLPARRV